MVDFPAGFVAPELDTAVELEALIASVAQVQVRGMFLNGVVDRCRADGIDLGQRYIAFKLYPIETHLRLIAEGTRALWPQATLRRGLWSLAHDAFGALLDSMAGRVVFGVLGGDVHRVTRLVGKAYEIGGTGVSARLLHMGDDFSHVRIEGAHGLLCCYHAGAFLGTLTACGLDGEVRVRDEGASGELFTRWWPRAGGRSTPAVTPRG
jgi:uncharacterized protein (TIGR02265 family)